MSLGRYLILYCHIFISNRGAREPLGWILDIHLLTLRGVYSAKYLLIAGMATHLIWKYRPSLHLENYYCAHVLRQFQLPQPQHTLYYSMREVVFWHQKKYATSHAY